MASKKIALADFPTLLHAPVDVFICSASFESRCLSIPTILPEDAARVVLVCANENFPHVVKSSGKFLLNRFGRRSRMVSLSTEDPLKTADSLQTAIKEAVAQSCHTFLIDITTFTHESLLILLRVLQLNLSEEDMVHCVYTSASEYSIGDSEENKWLSKGIEEVRSVLGYPGNILPTRKLHLVILAGFEGERAERLIEEYEPTRISLGLGDPAQSITPSHYAVNRRVHNRLSEKYTDVSTFLFSCSDPEASKEAIAVHLRDSPGFNVLISPMNTKISTIGAALVAADDDSIQMCYAGARQYNERAYSEPGLECYYFLLALPVRR